jgi:hypothetical protein
VNPLTLFLGYSLSFLIFRQSTTKTSLNAKLLTSKVADPPAFSRTHGIGLLAREFGTSSLILQDFQQEHQALPARPALHDFRCSRAP